MSTKIEVINQDLTTKEGWDEYIQFIQKAKADRAKFDELKFVEATLVVTSDPVTDERLPHPSAVVIAGMFQGNNDEEVEDSKNRFSKICISMSLLGRAVATLFFSETWFVEGEAARQAYETGVQPRQHAQRQEALNIMTDHREFGRGFYIAMITPKTKRRRKIGPWTNTFDGRDTKHSHTSGRFATFLVDPAKAEDPAHRTIARLYLSMQEDYLHMFRPKEKSRAAQG